VCGVKRRGVLYRRPERVTLRSGDLQRQRRAGAIASPICRIGRLAPTRTAHAFPPPVHEESSRGAD
jgi:hypothetical protein